MSTSVLLASGATDSAAPALVAIVASAYVTFLIIECGSMKEFVRRHIRHAATPQPPTVPVATRSGDEIRRDVERTRETLHALEAELIASIRDDEGLASSNGKAV